MKKYIQPSLTVIKMEIEDVLCLSVSDNAADKDAEVLTRHKNSWSSDIWSAPEEKASGQDHLEPVPEKALRTAV